MVILICVYLSFLFRLQILLVMAYISQMKFNNHLASYTNEISLTII